MLNRRRLLASGASVVAANALLPSWAKAVPLENAPDVLSGPIINLTIGKTWVDRGGKAGWAKTINGTLPGPLIRLVEGQDVELRVTNTLDEDTSIHWHGILLPTEMDGVPGLSFPGIKPGETFVYRYKVRQNGTYWYHSHSGLQEQEGVYGPLVIDPAQGPDHAVDRDQVIVLSDWTDENANHLFARLKKAPASDNLQHRTMLDFFSDVEAKGLQATLADRKAWGDMRMDPTDISDVTAATYAYLMNGQGTEANWTQIYEPGESLRLRFVNAAAMTIFNVRIPGLSMEVVAVDGQPVQPVRTEEFQISVAETYDVIVRPIGDKAYTIHAATIDGSGYARGTLAPRMGMVAAIPPRRERPLLTMKDMGMDHSKMAHSNMDHSKMDHSQMDHAAMGHTPALPVTGEPIVQNHGVDMLADAPANRLDERGLGQRGVSGHRVLTYEDLKAPAPWPDQRPPARELIINLTGNMERYMWSFDGAKYSEVKGPIPFTFGERLKLTLINHTMMNHPIHLHGMWMELDNGNGVLNPRKHTINVKPGEKVSALISADAKGLWAFHCHLLMHMKAGMMRAVKVDGEVTS